MPNEYSIEIHNYISDQVAQQQKVAAQKTDGLSSGDREYARGRLNELEWLRGYLSKNIDLKDFTYY